MKRITRLAHDGRGWTALAVERVRLGLPSDYDESEEAAAIYEEAERRNQPPSPEDTRLRDEVAMRVLAAGIANSGITTQLVGSGADCREVVDTDWICRAFEIADAFMAERAKRGVPK